jgi:hypothetical protein
MRAFLGFSVLKIKVERKLKLGVILTLLKFDQKIYFNLTPKFGLSFIIKNIFYQPFRSSTSSE